MGSQGCIHALCRAYHRIHQGMLTGCLNCREMVGRLFKSETFDLSYLAGTSLCFVYRHNGENIYATALCCTSNVPDYACIQKSI